MPWRSAFTEEWLGRPSTEVGAPPPFEALHTRRWMWVEYRNGWLELYDLRRDPYELNNLAQNPSTAGLRKRLSMELRRMLRAPPGS